MTHKEKVETIQSVFTILAIIAGGIWAATIFFQERRHSPHFRLGHSFEYVNLNDELFLLKTDVKITNVGTSSFTLNDSKVTVRILQIWPFIACSEHPCYQEELKEALLKVERKNDVFMWPLIGERDRNIQGILIEPGEDPEFSFEFIIPKDVSIIKAYSSIIVGSQKNGGGIRADENSSFHILK